MDRVDDEALSMVAAKAVWLDGKEVGFNEGLKLGEARGRSTLSRNWFFFTAVILYCIGLLMGVGTFHGVEYLHSKGVLYEQ